MKGIFYGWWLVLACLLIQGIVTGVTIYSYSLYAGEIEQAFQASRAVVMLGMTGQSIMIGLLAPWLGALLDRVSIRGTMTLTAVIMGAGFFAISFSPTVWGFVAGYALLVSVGLSALGMMSASVLLSRWFLRHRGFAIGLAALGTQLGGFAIPPALAWLIDSADWRFALRAVGLCVALLIPLLARLVIDRPSMIGLGVDGDPPAETEGRQGTPTSGATAITLRQILAERKFWLGGFGIAIMVAMFTTVLANLALFATDMGIPREQAARLIALYAVVGMIASPIIGRACDMFDIRWVFTALLILNITSMALFLRADDLHGLMAATAVVAISGGGLTSFWSALVGKLFAIQFYARVMGTMTLFTVTAGALAPLLSGWLHDLTGSYRTLFLALLVLMAIPLLYSPLLGERSRRPAA